MDRCLVVIFGLMGVGKTTVAEALSRARGWPVIHSDAVRKELAGLTPTTPAHFEFGQGIYDAGFSQKTYSEMRRRAKEMLDAGATGVILDASFKSVGRARPGQGAGPGRASPRGLHILLLPGRGNTGAPYCQEGQQQRHLGRPPGTPRFADGGLRRL